MAFNKVESVQNMVPVSNVLVSVYDKTDLGLMIDCLLSVNKLVKFYSTGGTYDFIKKQLGPIYENNLISVSAYTKQNEMQGGLVKTLDWHIYLGLLAENNNALHDEAIKNSESVKFDMVICNLYPFLERYESGTIEELRQNIDIGGPCMLRAAAKNFLRVASVADPSLYRPLIAELNTNNGSLSFKTRRILAKETFKRISAYDNSVFSMFQNKSDDFFTNDYKF